MERGDPRRAAIVATKHRRGKPLTDGPITTLQLALKATSLTSFLDPKAFPSMRLRYFDNLRGIAILLVVAGHSLTPWTLDSLPEIIISNVIVGGTALFVFISGFFFHNTFAARFNYLGFLKKKATQILVPYVVLSLAGIIVFGLMREHLPEIQKISALFNLSAAGTGANLKTSAAYLLTGAIAAPYWYIPFIYLIFIASPAFLVYARAGARIQITVASLCLVLSCLIHRPVANLNPLHSLAYFTPHYMAGILYSAHREKAEQFLRGKFFATGVMVLVLASLQALAQSDQGNYHKDFFVYQGIDILIFQKAFLVAFFLSFLLQYKDRELPLLGFLAERSFALYFIHFWVIYFLVKTSLYRSVYAATPGFFVFVLTATAALVISIVVAQLFKSVFGSRSRYLTGW